MPASFKVTKYGIIGNLTGSVQGTASYAITASYVPGIPDVSIFVASASYSTSDKKIYFYSSTGSQLAFIDATDFIKDGMVDTVTVNTGSNQMIITFNTDAGKEDIELSLTDIFNPSNYYDKDDVDLIISGLPRGIEAITFNDTPASVSDGTASISYAFVEEDPIYLADSASLKASASVATSASNWITANSGNLHTHSNKGLLDSIDDTAVNSWDDAADSAHTHSNAALLNSLTNTKTGSWDSAATSATALNSISASLIASGTLAKNVTAITASLVASASVAKSASASAAAISAKTGSYDALMGLPAVTSADEGKILRVVSGSWALVTPVTVYSGTGAPDASTGIDGDIYLQTS